MSGRNTLAETFNIRPGEGLSIVLLGSYSFLAGICLAYVISLGNASFLVAFGTAFLPKGYIATGIAGYVVGAGLSQLQRWLSFPRLILVCIGFLLLVTCVLWVGHLFPPDAMFYGLALEQWLALGMFVGIGPYIMLVYFVFRSVAGRLFDLRQGKRLFGLISTGEVISTMAGFFSVPLLLRVLPRATDLLVIAAISLGLCLWVLVLIQLKFSSRLADPPVQAQKKGDVGSWGTLFQSRYAVLLLLLASASVFGFYYVDYVFLGELRTRFPDQKQLAQFIGIFYGAIRVVEFALKTFVSGRLINQYGLRFGLVVLPVLLLACSGLASIFQLSGWISPVFLVLTLTKLIERVVAKSLYDPAFNVLYQPIDARVRLAVQTRVEGIVQQLAVVLAGGSLLLFGWFGSFQLVLYVLVAVFVGWLVGAVWMNRAYRESLLQHLSGRSRIAVAPGRDEVSALWLAEQAKGIGSERSALAGALMGYIDSGAEDRVFPAEWVAQLGTPGMGNAAVFRLLANGEEALPALQGAFRDPAQSPVVLRRIARIFGQCRAPETIGDLLLRLNTSGKGVRREVLTSLRLRGFAPQGEQVSLIRHELDATLNAATWCMAALLDMEGADVPHVRAAIGRELDETRERLFHLLSLMYDVRHIELVRESFKSGSNDGKVYALELIDVFVDQEIKSGLFPVLDDLALGQRLKRLEETFPQQRLGLDARLKDIVNRPFGSIESWTRACAVHAFAHPGAIDVPAELIAVLFHPERLLRDTAVWSLRRIDADAYARHLHRLPVLAHEGLPVLDGMSLFERVLFLKGMPAFSNVPEYALTELAQFLKPVYFERGARIFDGEERCLQALVAGRVRVMDDVLGANALLGRWTNTEEAVAETRVDAFEIDEAIFSDLVADEVELARGFLQGASTSRSAANVFSETGGLVR